MCVYNLLHCYTIKDLTKKCSYFSTYLCSLARTPPS